MAPFAPSNAHLVPPARRSAARGKLPSAKRRPKPAAFFWIGGTASSPAVRFDDAHTQGSAAACGHARRLRLARARSRTSRQLCEGPCLRGPLSAKARVCEGRWGSRPAGTTCSGVDDDVIPPVAAKLLNLLVVPVPAKAPKTPARSSHFRHAQKTLKRPCWR